MSRQCVLLLSGGLDSYTAGAMLKAEGFDLYALSVRYGQRHVRELEAARSVAIAITSADPTLTPPMSRVSP